MEFYRGRSRREEEKDRERRLKDVTEGDDRGRGRKRGKVR